MVPANKKNSKRYDVPLDYVHDGDVLVCFTDKNPERLAEARWPMTGRSTGS